MQGGFEITILYYGSNIYMARKRIMFLVYAAITFNIQQRIDLFLWLFYELLNQY